MTLPARKAGSSSRGSSVSNADSHNDSPVSHRSCRSSRRSSPRQFGRAAGESLVGSLLLATQSFKEEAAAAAGDTDCPTAVESQSLVRRQLVNGTSWWNGVVIMANCTIGMGLLNFPRAIAQSGGIANALLLQLLALVLTLASLYMLGRCCLHTGASSFQEMVTDLLGSAWGNLAKLCIFLVNVGVCIMLLVVLGDQFERLLLMIYKEEFCRHRQKFIDRSQLVPLATTVAIVPFCLLPRFDLFKYTSYIGVLAAVYISFGVAVTRAITDNVASDVLIVSPMSVNSLSIVPLVCFAYECHVEVPPMMQCLRHRSLSYFMRTAAGYLAVSLVVYTCGGVAAYATFGDTLPGDFLLRYSQSDHLVTVAMALISAKILTTYPLLFYCVRLVLDELWLRCLPIWLEDTTLHCTCRRLVQTLIIVYSTVAAAVFAPSVTDVIAIVGGLSALFVFVFPGLCYLSLISSEYSNEQSAKFQTAGSCFLVVVGAFVFGLVTSQSTMQFVRGGTPEPGLCTVT